MATQTARRGGTSARGDIALLIVVLAAIALVCMIGWSIAGARALLGEDTSWNPLQILIEVAMGRASVPPLAVMIGAIPLIALAAGFVAWARHHKRHQSARSPIDSAAKTMQPTNRLSGLTRDEAAKDAQRLLPGFESGDSPGILLGSTVAGNREIFLPWEAGALIIAGPRMGKTTAFAVPAVMEAPGAVVATSNKGDIFDDTHLHRSTLGQVWLFDPQGVTGDDRQRLWWNPLERITRVREARKLASFFVSAGKEAGARVDSYFDGGAQELLACMILAAASADDGRGGSGDLVHCYNWLGNFLSETPSVILSAAGHDYAARRLAEARALNERQRDGLVDMARRFLGVLSDPEYAALVCPPRRLSIELDGDTPIYRLSPQTHELPQFHPDEFVASTDTLYALSIEGADSATALVTALVGQVFEEAVKRGAQSPGRRLTPPLVAVLDEAANVCKLGELPAQYSHFGSRGIIPITFLQSPAQGVGVWGKEGMDALMSAANVKIYGGNVVDDQYLGLLSKLIGEHDVLTESRSRGQNNSSTSQSWKRESILTVADLGALPADRAIIQAAKNAPVLARKIGWWDRPYAATVTESKDSLLPAPQASSVHPTGVEDHAADDTVPDDMDLLDELDAASDEPDAPHPAEVVALHHRRSPGFGPGSGYRPHHRAGEIEL